MEYKWLYVKGQDTLQDPFLSFLLYIVSCLGVPPASIHLGRFREDSGICDFYYNYEFVQSADKQMYFGFPFSL